MISTNFIPVKAKLEANTVLIALVRSKKDWKQVLEQRIYRIPTRSAPSIVSNGTIEYIAFYLPSEFGNERYSIPYYGKIHTIKMQPRIEMVPDEPHHKKAHVNYYRIEIEELLPLREPFVSLRPRRLLFIPTSEQKFFRPVAREINHLFNDSPLENLLWDSFYDKRIPAERQYQIETKGKTYHLDFAIFCQKKNLNIECDGDSYHNSKKAIEYDKFRGNQLASAGWVHLRFTTDKLTYELPEVMKTVTDTVNLYGGVQEPQSDYSRYIKDDSDDQQRLFD